MVNLGILLSGIMIGVASLFSARFNTRALVWVSRISGVVIVAFGLAALVSRA